ncbi:MAG: KEOPS complex subunit Pcc1 [Thermofilaceae archaeon]|nr:KEOPS complex subunit Pcc1 [Thermofilaceae archaeon]MDW8003802.1 KEOPS complex subunit Pcc1 [Thermofilaceae archaeon]
MSIKVSNIRDAEAIYRSLVVEAFSQPTPHVKIDVQLKDSEIIIGLFSTRRTLLRASLNSFFRLIATLDNVSRSLEARA